MRAGDDAFDLYVEIRDLNHSIVTHLIREIEARAQVYERLLGGFLVAVFLAFVFAGTINLLTLAGWLTVAWTAFIGTALVYHAYVLRRSQRKYGISFLPRYKVLLRNCLYTDECSLRDMRLHLAKNRAVWFLGQVFGWPGLYFGYLLQKFLLMWFSPAVSVWEKRTGRLFY